MKDLKENFDALPLIFGRSELQELLGTTSTNSYYLLRCEWFPTITIGKRKLVRKDKFKEWVLTTEEFPAYLEDKLSGSKEILSE